MYRDILCGPELLTVEASNTNLLTERKQIRDELVLVLVSMSIIIECVSARSI